jgi:hypothetical protein
MFLTAPSASGLSARRGRRRRVNRNGRQREISRGCDNGRVHTPSWIEFAERPVPEFEVSAPASELASVLQRYRADLDAAARAGAEGRAQGLRALAEQAVLAIELEKQLERSGGPSLEPLRALRDRMLSQIEAAGLEIVRLRGAAASEVAGLVQVDSWRYDDIYTSEVVIEELEVAVRHLGVPLRLGRVVMGAPPTGGPRLVDDRPDADATPTPPIPHAALSSPPGASPARIVCPVADCGAENDVDAEVCVACLTQIAGYRRLWLYPQVLFNRGLQAARAGHSQAARDCFAAVVLWSPEDIETRNAYALACLESHDAEAARRAWEEVLTRAPADTRARRGMRALLQSFKVVPEA